MSDCAVIIVAHNEEQRLGRAIDSVLAQTEPPRELIVVDDGSTDRSMDVAVRWSGVRVVRQERAGAAAARNRGARLSVSPWLAFLDADDRFLPEKLERYRVHLRQSLADCAFGHFRYRLDEPTVPHGFRAELLDRDLLGRIPSTLVVQRDVMERCPFDESYATSEDVEWLRRFRDQGGTETIVPGVWSEKFVRSDSLSLSHPSRSRNLLRALRPSRHVFGEGATR